MNVNAQRRNKGLRPAITRRGAGPSHPSSECDPDVQIQIVVVGRCAATCHIVRRGRAVELVVRHVLQAHTRVLPRIVVDLADRAAILAQAATGNIAATAVGNTDNNAKVLRAGFEKTKPLNNLDVYGNKSLHELGGNAEAPESAFNASQRLGNVSKFSYNTSYTKPLYNVSEYSRTKPIYQVPSGLSSKPVYDIEKYSVIKAPNGIP